jgi:hypothetical protein
VTIPLTCSAHAARALNRALGLVNKHLAALNMNGALDGHELPTMFELVPVADGTRVHIRSGIAEVEQASDTEWDEPTEVDDDWVDKAVQEREWRVSEFWQQQREKQKRKWAAEVDREEREREELNLALWGRP